MSTLDRMQEALPGPLRRVPLQALVAAAGLAFVSVTSVALAVVRGDAPIAALEREDTVGNDAGAVTPTRRAAASTGSGSRSAGPTRVTAAELDAAKLGGASALLALAERYPEEAPVLQALCAAQVHDQKDFLAAVRTLRHLLQVAPEKSADRDVQQLVLEIANGPPDAAEEAFDILKTKMDGRGPDLLFELISGATGRYAKEHAATALADPAVQKLATKALVVADELRKTLPCARKGLVPRAAAEGDTRSLPYLRQLIPAKNCRGGGLVGLFRGGSDCHLYECFTPADRATIASAIDAIEKREKR